MRSRILGRCGAGALGLLLPLATLTPADAGSVSVDGDRVVYANPLPPTSTNPKDNGLSVYLFQSPGAAKVSFVEPAPGTIAGPGCVAGAGATDCAVGARLPREVVIFLGRGNDSANVGSEALQSTRVTIFGGPGNDEISKIQAYGTIDGGFGDDTILPDSRYVTTPTPAATPGDVISGNQGIDYVNYALSRTGVTVTLDGVADDGRTGAGEGDNVLPDVENIVGSTFGDRLVGSPAVNLILAGAGDDSVVGGAGRDRLDTGDGNDVVDALDGDIDRVVCGAGNDTAYVDGRDIVVRSGDDRCERVVRTAIVRSSSRLTGRTVALRASCPRSTTRCRGVVRLSVPRNGVMAAVGSARYALKRGRSATVRVKVSARTARLIRKQRTTRAVLVNSPKGFAATTGRTVKIKR